MYQHQSSDMNSHRFAERLMKASRSIAAVHDDINITDRLIGGIESFWTAVANKFRFDNTKDNRRAHARHEDKLEAQLANDDNMHAIAEHDASQEARRAELRRMSERTAQSKFGVKEVDDYFEETDKDLDELSDVLAEIKRDSLRMRAGIARDNAVLDHLEPEAARLEERVRKSNTRIDRIIK